MALTYIHHHTDYSETLVLKMLKHNRQLLYMELQMVDSHLKSKWIHKADTERSAEKKLRTIASILKSCTESSEKASVFSDAHISRITKELELTKTLIRQALK